jgi:predicted 2-oxoglutarate/Fe(II)-dependent dioxygenase YbiX
MYVESNLGDKGLYILDCVDQKHIDLVCDLEQRLNPIDQLKYIRSGFTISDDELSIYLTKNINAAILEYINRSNKEISDYIARDSYQISSWKLGVSLAPHIDTIKYDHEDTHTPRSAINALLYLTDDYEGGEISFPEINIAIKPKAGSVVVFDADLMHGVNAVENGMRKTLESHLYSIYSDDIEEVKAYGWRTL